MIKTKRFYAVLAALALLWTAIAIIITAILNHFGFIAQ